MVTKLWNLVCKLSRYDRLVNFDRLKFIAVQPTSFKASWSSATAETLFSHEKAEPHKHFDATRSGIGLGFEEE